MLAFLRGTLDPAAVAAVEDEVDRCDTCRTLLAHVAKQVHADLVELAPDTEVGRYRVQKKLGAGAMGIVYAARDPVVHRLVALKLIPARTFREPDGVLREARALGAVSHAAVVPVYDAGVTDNHVFVAMELLDGATLSTYVAEPDVLVRAFARIAEGLAAAHEAGIIHGDFKPDNVMVTADGSPKITDFGLARIRERPHATDAGAIPQLARGSTTGGGTPGYMAPEQFAGEGASPLTDQFAFFVSLYEALSGKRPFARTSVQLHGDAPIDMAKIPRRLRSVVARGLAVDPEQRFPSMREVARALSRARTSYKRWVVAVAAVVPLAAAAAIFVMSQRGTSDPCAGAAASVAPAWTDWQRATVLGTARASTLPYANDAANQLTRDLDGYTRSLRDGYVRACRATHVAHTQSADLLDRRTQCLGDATRELQTLTTALVGASPRTVAKAGSAAARLPELARCDDVQTLQELVPLPADPAKRAEIERANQQVAEANTGISTGRYRDALERAKTAAKAAEATGYRKSYANAMYVLAKMQWATGDLDGAKTSLDASLLAATAARDRANEARVHLDLARLIGIELAKPQDAEQHAALGLALTEAMPDAQELTAGFLEYRGGVVGRQNATARLDNYERALKLLEGHDARQETTAHLLGLKGMVLCELGKREEGVAALKRDLEISERLTGKAHPAYANELSNLANCYAIVDEPKALELELQAHAIRAKALDPDHIHLGISAGQVGQMLTTAGRLDEALPLLHQSLTIKRKALPAGHPSIGISLINLARAYGYAKQPAKQLQYATEARDLFAAAVGPDNPDLAASWSEMGLGALALDRVPEAIAALEQSTAIFRKGEGQDYNVANNDYNLANVLWDTKRDRTRAVKLMTEARDLFGKFGATDGRDDAAKWLTAHKQ